METIKGKYVNGSSVVEMAYIMPLFLGLFVILIHAVFYYHDKAVINGAQQCLAHRRTEMRLRIMIWKGSFMTGRRES